MLARILELDLPTVVDADALNLLARDPLKKQNWILTPHPGEAARLTTGATSQEVQQQRLVRVQALQQKFGGGVCPERLRHAGRLRRQGFSMYSRQSRDGFGWNG